MHLVLEARVLPFRKQLGIVGDDVAQGLDPRLLALGEIAEHVWVHQLLDAGMTDADAPAAMVMADMRRERARAVVPAAAAAGLDPNLRRREVDLVVEYHDVGKPELVEMRGFRHRAAGVVHERAGEQQQPPLAAERAFRRDTLEAPPPRTDAVTLGDRVD